MMKEQLLNLEAKYLLKKFGAGAHVPGSGSAAALLGMVSAQLLRTLIELTERRNKKGKYSHWLPELIRIKDEIDNRILPTLENLFQTDSDQFKKTIDLRKARDKERIKRNKAILANRAAAELKPATSIPVEIANLCVELADFAAYIFVHGWEHARGDAGVAQNSAIAAIGGCLSIINLNLLSFQSDGWTLQRLSEVNQLHENYLRLTTASRHNIDLLKEEANSYHKCRQEINAFLSDLPDESELTDEVIEQVARQLQLLLWKNKDVVWKNKEVDNPLDVLQPDIALKLLGYNFYKSVSIGQHTVNGGDFEVAGLIDKQRKYVEVSQAFEEPTQKFTSAHELGHALFHKRAILHRDRPLDGTSSGYHRDPMEFQADKFAACFLMPQKQVIAAFKHLFSTERFVVNANSVFELTNDTLAAFRKNFPTKWDIAKFLAKPLAEHFQVSVGAMARRLDELDLIVYG